jgi:hypothetical protein
MTSVKTTIKKPAAQVAASKKAAALKAAADEPAAEIEVQFRALDRPDRLGCRRRPAARAQRDDQRRCGHRGEPEEITPSHGVNPHTFFATCQCPFIVTAKRLSRWWT